MNNTAKKKVTKKQPARTAEPVVKAEAQLQAVQTKAETVQCTRLHMDRAGLQEALVWTEILGEPKCRKRHPRRSRLSSNQ